MTDFSFAQRRAFILLLLSILSMSTARAQDVGRFDWELGASLAALSVPLYAGSAQSRAYFLPLPYGKLHSDVLIVDDGVRAKLFGVEALRLSLSADFGVPVSSEDSVARAGMPDLDTVLQLGPLLEFGLDGSETRPRQWKLELPLRLAFATDFESAENLGWIAEPRLSYQRRRLHGSGFAWQMTAGLRFASAAYHDYYYAVPAEYVSSARTGFDASGGYSGMFADVLASWRQRDVIFWALLRYQNLSAAVFEDSPLVERKDYYFVGAGITWVLWQNR